MTSTVQHNNEAQAVSLESDAKYRSWRPSKDEKLAFAAQAFCVFVISLDMTILTATLPTVSQALHATATESFWIAASYLLASAVCQPTMAALAEAFGPQAMFMGSVATFTIGSIICSVAPNVSAMLAGRTVQGIGGGGIISVNLIILTDLVVFPRERAKYQGIIQLPFALGTNIAPIIGGAFIKTNWRWIFYINLPFCAIGLVAIYFLLQYEDRKPATVSETSRSVDWAGFGLMVASSTLFLIGMSWGGNTYPWRSAAVLVTTLAGLLGLVLTVFYERFIPKNPFLRLAIFETWSGILVSICTMIQGYLLFATTYFLVIYLMACKLYSPIMAGIGLLPYAMTVVPISAITGIVITRSERYRWAIWLGWTISVLGLGLLIILDVRTSPGAWVVIFMLAGAGQGLLLNGHAAAITASCASEHAAYAINMYAFMRSFGLCLGVIIGGTVFQNFFRMHLERNDLSVDIAANFEGFILKLQSLPATESQRLEFQNGYAWALRMLFATSTGISVVGLLLSSAICGYTMDVPHMPERGLRKRELKRRGSETEIQEERT